MFQFFQVDILEKDEKWVKARIWMPNATSFVTFFSLSEFNRLQEYKTFLMFSGPDPSGVIGTTPRYTVN
jgi:hypothetical protein